MCIRKYFFGRSTEAPDQRHVFFAGYTRPTHRCSGRPLSLNPRGQRHITLAARFRSGLGSAGARDVPSAATMHSSRLFNPAIKITSRHRRVVNRTLNDVHSEVFLCSQYRVASRLQYGMAPGQAIFAAPLPKHSQRQLLYVPGGWPGWCREGLQYGTALRSRHRAPLFEPEGRVFARMAANQRLEIHRKRSPIPDRNVGICLCRQPFHPHR